TELRPPDTSPEDNEASDRSRAHDEHRRQQRRPGQGQVGEQYRRQDEGSHDNGRGGDAVAHGCHDSRELFSDRMIPETNYTSGEDYEIEFLGYRFAFNAFDFEQRVTAAGVKLGLLEGNELDDDETADLVELVHRGLIDEPRSRLGRYAA